MNDKDKIWKDIAQAYTEGEGRALEAERMELERGAVFPTESLERRVLGIVRRRKRLRYLQSFAAAAAVLALVLIGTQAWRQAGGDSQAPAVSGQIAEATQQPPADSPVPPQYAVIPLSFPVPEGFTQTGFEQDYAKSVYTFADSMADDVVLTMLTSGEQPHTAGLTAVDINGATAYAAAGDGFCLLTFSKDGVLYELTCRYDVNTLTRFGKNIL